MKDGGPAFPVYPKHEGTLSKEIKDTLGMSLRDYFACRAIQGMVANPRLKDEVSNMMIAEEAYDVADAMLKAREYNK